MRLVIDGVAAILAEHNPRRLEQRLDSFLTPAARTGDRRSVEELRLRFEERRQRESEQLESLHA
jgi:flagellar motor component MotA